MNFDDDENDTVPTTYPFGSITDGLWHCTRCGEDRTGCDLCAGMDVQLRRSKRISDQNAERSNNWKTRYGVE